MPFTFLACLVLLSLAAWIGAHQQHERRWPWYLLGAIVLPMVLTEVSTFDPSNLYYLAWAAALLSFALAMSALVQKKSDAVAVYLLIPLAAFPLQWAFRLPLSLFVKRNVPEAMAMGDVLHERIHAFHKDEGHWPASFDALITWDGKPIPSAGIGWIGSQDFDYFYTDYFDSYSLSFRGGNRREYYSEEAGTWHRLFREFGDD